MEGRVALTLSMKQESGYLSARGEECIGAGPKIYRWTEDCKFQNDPKMALQVFNEEFKCKINSKCYLNLKIHIIKLHRAPLKSKVSTR